MCTGLIEILLPFPFEIVIDRTLRAVSDLDSANLCF